MTFSFDSALFDRLHRVYLNKSSTSVIRQTKTNNNSTPAAQTKEREKNRYENIFRKKTIFFYQFFFRSQQQHTLQTHTYKNQIATWHWIFNVVHFICLLLLCALHAFYAKSLRASSSLSNRNTFPFHFLNKTLHDLHCTFLRFWKLLLIPIFSNQWNSLLSFDFISMFLLYRQLPLCIIFDCGL